MGWDGLGLIGLGRVMWVGVKMLSLVGLGWVGLG